MSTAVHLFDLTAHTVMAGVGRMEDMVVQVRDRRTPLEVEQPREPVPIPTVVYPPWLLPSPSSCTVFADIVTQASSQPVACGDI